MNWRMHETENYVHLRACVQGPLILVDDLVEEAISIPVLTDLLPFSRMKRRKHEYA